MSSNNSGGEKLNWDFIKSKEQSFYLDLSENPPTAGFKSLLEKYSEVPTESIESHIEKVVRIILRIEWINSLIILYCDSVTRLGGIIHIHLSAFMSSMIWVSVEMISRKMIPKSPKLFRQHIRIFSKN